MINPALLKTFCTLADIGHFTQTANVLFMTQSGVSQQIMKLEQQLDTPLLIREGKTFVLTEAGIRLHKQGTELLNNLIALEESIKIDDPFYGTVKISSPGSIGLKLYPHLLDIQQQHLNLIIDYRFAPNREIIEKIIDRKIDIGLVTEISQAKNIVCKKITEEPLVLVTASNIKSVNWQTLLSLGFIAHPDAPHQAQLLLSKNFSAFEHIDQFAQKGFSNQIGLILEPISRGLGFTVLPLNAVKAFHKPTQIQVHRLDHTAVESLFLCHNAQAFNAKRNSYVKSVIEDFIS